MLLPDEKIKLLDNTFSDHDFNIIISILLQAGEIALMHYKNQSIEVTYKEDESPVTNADIEISDLVIKKLMQLQPVIAVVSEENFDNYSTQQIFWLLDPIDGTKNYINGGFNYSINLSLVYKHKPVLGFMYHPSTKELFFNNFKGAYKFVDNKITPLYSQSDESKLKVLIDRDSLKPLELFKHNQSIFTQVAPNPYLNKLAMVLTFDADAYYIYRPSMEWDTGAVHAILNKIGGDIIDMTGNSLVYGKPMFGNSDIIVCTQRALENKRLILDSI